MVTMTLSDTLTAYFNCVNELAQTGSTQEEARKVLRCCVNKYKPNLDMEKHPLAKWNMEECLARDLGIDLDSSKSVKSPVEKGNNPKSVKASDVNTIRNAASSGESTTAEWENHRLLVPPYRFEIRPHRTDYVPRSGQPSSYDYKLATVLGSMVGQLLEQGNFGVVPCLSEVVSYSDLGEDVVKFESINDIRTLTFDKDDYFDIDSFTVADKITDFFRTITTGPDNLETAIDEFK